MSTPTQVPVSTGTSSVSGSISFSIGSSANDPNAIVFGQANTPTSVSPIEIPDRLGPLGGRQTHAVHQFPGGLKTLQTFGAFPETLSWQGILLGGNAFARSFQLDTMRRTGAAAFLSYGPWRWTGVLTEYLAIARHPNYVSYHCSFEPAVDLTASGQAQPPGLGTTQSTLTQVVNGIDQLYESEQPVLSSGSLSALEVLSKVAGSIIQGLTGAGLLTASQLRTLGAATQAATTALGVDAVSGDAQVAAAAAGALSLVSAVSGVLPKPIVQTTLRAVNPNLAFLASQYLGDASRWSDIASLNGLLDIAPTGIFVLNIPNV